ncbi:hypothetical protein JL722_1619 [Aureococcus anophagefferens]|nr:hypothetical protein JL722_1619 [Aureococcus anophagefferens]
MASSKGGLRLVGSDKGAAAHTVAADAAPAAAAPAEDPDKLDPNPPVLDKFGNPRIKTERVENVMGSQAGAGSGDFHMYRHHRRTEMLRVERMERQAGVDDEDDAAAAPRRSARTLDS